MISMVMKQLRLIIAGRMGFIGRPVVRFYRGTTKKQKLTRRLLFRILLPKESQKMILSLSRVAFTE